MIELFEAIHHYSMLFLGFSTDGLITIFTAVFCLNFILYTRVIGGLKYLSGIEIAFVLILIKSLLIVIFPIYSILFLILAFILYFIARLIKPESSQS